MADLHVLDLGCCPSCGEPMTGFAGGPEAPAPGDFSICAYCGTYLVVIEGGLRRLTNKEWQALSPGHRAWLTHVRDNRPRPPRES